MELQREIDEFTTRLFTEPNPKEVIEHHEFLQKVLTGPGDGLTVEESVVLLNKIDQICILITTFYILAKARNQDLDELARPLKRAIMTNLCRRAALDIELTSNMIN